MRQGEEQEIAIEDFFSLCAEGGLYQIDTPDGWQNIEFLIKKNKKESYNLVLQDGTELGCSADHYVLTSNGWKNAEEIDVQNDMVITRTGEQPIVAKEYLGIKDTYDLGVDSDQHRYFSNDIISHNTGKSMISDALAQLYQMPLLRLDVGSLFSAHIGESEENVRLAIQTAEAIAPAILWIDEVEKGLGGVQSSNVTDGGVTNRVFGSLLTWMQDKTVPVFVIATANNVTEIPPEFQRAGRFDEIFFLDLPDAEQRKEVAAVLLKRKHREPKDFNLDDISKATESYSPAEIEKAINNALFVAYSEGKRQLTTSDITVAASRFQPLYNSRREEMDAMRAWANGKACLANSSGTSIVTAPAVTAPVLAEDGLCIKWDL